MAEIAVLQQALGARTTPTARGATLTFERAGQWHSMAVRESPHLELSLPASELQGLGVELWLRFGLETVRGGDTPAADPRWSVRHSAAIVIPVMLAEPPWPRRTEGPVRRALRRLLDLGPQAGALGEGPTPSYALEIVDGVATAERRSSETDSGTTEGLAERLLQLVTWPDRLTLAMRAAADALGGTARTERWDVQRMSIDVPRGTRSVRIEHVTEPELATRVVVRGSTRDGILLPGIVLEATHLAAAVDEVVRRADADAGRRAPYR